MTSSNEKFLSVRRVLVAGVVLILVLLAFQNCGRFDAFSGIETSIEDPLDPNSLAGAKEGGPIAAYSWKYDGCNATSFHQDPDDMTLFWGRRLRYSGAPGENPNDECTWTTWGVAIFRADFVARYLRFERFIYNGIAPIGGSHTISTGYDPSVARINGTKLIAFECHGPSMSESVGVCVGPLGTGNDLDLSRTRVYVEGRTSTPSAFFLSASVPKLLQTTKGAYLSWTQVKIDKSNGRFVSLKTRAIPFSLNMEAVNSDSSAVTDIYNPLTPDGTADIFQIREFGAGQYYYTAARGENGCTVPLQEIAGCYRLEVGKSQSRSLSERGALDKSVIFKDLSPDNPTEYFRFAYDPSLKKWGVFGHVLPKFGTPTDRTLPVGMTFIPVESLEESLPIGENAPAPICDSVTQPFPHWGEKNGQCLMSCGALGGTHLLQSSCSDHSMISAGESYEAGVCCKEQPPVCHPMSQPFPHWGEKNGQCLMSCGALGGTAAYQDSCSNHGMLSAGTAYDTPYCCR